MGAFYSMLLMLQRKVIAQYTFALKRRHRYFHHGIICSRKDSCSNVSEMWYKTRIRLVDISKVGTSIDNKVCRALVGMHAYTGCDSVSAFAGKGNAGALKLLYNSREIQEMFHELGCEWRLNQCLVYRLEAFTCLLYVPKSSSHTVNALRYDLFCAKKGEVESHQLPPCIDCLQKHAQRANYQAAIWRRCLEQIPEVCICLSYL